MSQVATGGGHTCAIGVDDKVVCWGSWKGQTSPSTESFKAIAAGGANTCGIRDDDKVICWGNDAFGRAPQP